MNWVVESSMKMSFLFFVLLILNCMEAKRSPFDVQNTRSPIGVLALNLNTSSTAQATTDSQVPQYPNTLLRFFTNGTAVTMAATNESYFQDWSIDSSLPTGLSFDSATGRIVCSCETTLSYYKNTYTVSAKNKTSGNVVSTQVTIEVLSNFQLIDGNTSSGIGLASTSKYNPFPISYNGKLYVFVEESGVKGLVWSGTGYSTTDWTYVNGGSNFGGSTSMDSPTAVVWNNHLYLAFTRNVSPYYLYLKKFDGTTWTDVYRGANIYINQDTGTGFTSQSIRMEVFEGNLYILWIQNSMVQGVKIASDGTFTNLFTADGNYSVAMKSFSNLLFLTYGNNTSINLNFARVNGLRNGWDSPIQSNTTPFSFATGTTTGEPVMNLFDNKLYISWQEHNGSFFQIRVKEYDGGTFRFIDGNAANSLVNYNSSLNSLQPSISGINSDLYVSFVESSSKIRVKKWNSTNNWQSVGDPSSYVMNFSASATSVNRPRFVVHENVLYLTWEEQGKIRVRAFLQ